MKVAAIIQARMGSTRLPGKVLKKVLGKTLLEYQIERVRQAKTINEIIVATTLNKNDQDIVDFCKEKSIKCYRGSEKDVLSRYYEAASKYKVDVIVRLTSDCPVIDPDVIDKTVLYYLENQQKYDYVSNTITRTFPRGMDTEIFPFKILKTINLDAANSLEREHVTLYIYSNPNLFSLGNVSNEQQEEKYRLTVDTIEDFFLIERILLNLYPKNNDFKLKDIINLLNEYPDWVEINSNIQQKTL